MLTFEEVFNANKKQIVKNHKEWYGLITSKNPKKKEILESYRIEYKPFKAESSEEYATITIDNILKHFIGIDLITRNKYITKLLKEFKVKLD